MRAIPARIFVEHDGGYRFLEGVTLEALNCGSEVVECTLWGHLPPDVNLHCPQNLYLVYQDTDDARQFFTPQSDGFLATLIGFHIIDANDSVLMLVHNLATGEVTIPMAERHECTFNGEVNYADT